MSAEIGVKAAIGRVGVPTALMRLSTPLQKQTEEGVQAPAVVLLRAAGPDDEPQPVSGEGSRWTTGSCSFFRSHHLPTPRSPPGVAWVTLKPASLSATRYGSQGTADYQPSTACTCFAAAINWLAWLTVSPLPHCDCAWPMKSLTSLQPVP